MEHMAYAHWRTRIQTVHGELLLPKHPPPSTIPPFPPFTVIDHCVHCGKKLWPPEDSPRVSYYIKYPLNDTSSARTFWCIPCAKQVQNSTFTMADIVVFLELSPLSKQ
jgi:hypothetical protein